MGGGRGREGAAWKTPGRPRLRASPKTGDRETKGEGHGNKNQKKIGISVVEGKTSGFWGKKSQILSKLNLFFDSWGKRGKKEREKTPPKVSWILGFFKRAGFSPGGGKKRALFDPGKGPGGGGEKGKEGNLGGPQKKEEILTIKHFF